MRDYLAQCLESVINQDYKNLQIICVDDGSTDGSFEIAYKYFLKDTRITIIQRPNGGLSCARNTGLDLFFSGVKIQLEANNPLKAQWGEGDYQIFLHSLPFMPDYIHFLDSDDIFTKDCISECARLFVENDVDIVWHDFSVYYQQEQRIDNRRHFPFDVGTIPLISILEMLKKMNTKHFNFGWHGAFKTKLVKNIRFIEGIVYEDVSFAFFLFSQASHVALLDKQLICYYVREGSITNSKKQKNYPPYMKDLEGIFKTLEEAKFYNFFYSDCINILETDSFLRQRVLKSIDEKTASQLKKKMIEMLSWRTFEFLSIERHQINPDNDPRGCVKLYRQIRSLGYGRNCLGVLWIRMLRSVRDFIVLTRYRMGRIKRVVRKMLF